MCFYIDNVDIDKDISVYEKLFIFKVLKFPIEKI